VIDFFVGDNNGQIFFFFNYLVWGGNQRMRAKEQSKASSDQRAKNLEEAAFVLRGKSVHRGLGVVVPKRILFCRSQIRVCVCVRACVRFERRAPAVAE
jgi:hypothetical protein